MRKLTTILLALILCAALFVSCDANVIEETVSINFDGNARSLTASLEKFDKNDFYWTYTATKSKDDNSGLTSGATTGETWLKTNGTDKLKGLGSVSGFSQGKWDFVLYAYKNSDDSYPAYKGEVKGFSLKKGNDNTVTVTVSPVSDENANGTLVLNRNGITFKPKDVDKNSNNALNASTQVYHVTKLNDLNEISPIDGTTDTWSLKPGPYTVTVEFVKDGFIYATGSVVATIYSNLTTTVSGELTEQLTKASFDAEKNPDIINIVVGKETSYNDIGNDAITLTHESNNKVSAAVPASAAKSIIEEVFKNDTAVPEDAKIELNLSVDTTAATSTSLSLEIGMSAIVTHTDESNVVQQTSKVIEELSSRVTVTAQLQTGLKEVEVKHKGEKMTALTDLSADADGYNYNAETGVLTIKTKSFSPFEVEYKAPIYEAKINELKYESLEKAIKAAKSGETVTLIKDIELEKTLVLNDIDNVTLDLNNFSIIGNKCRAIHLVSGTLTIDGKGTVKSVGIIDNGKDSGNPSTTSVIRVTDNVANKTASLTIGEKVIVSSDCCYGVGVFGYSNGTLVVNGQIKTTNRPAIANNGSTGFAETNITLNGSVESTNELAIYHPGTGTITINGTVKGKGGIELKGGNLIVNDNARIEATSNPIHNATNGGTSTIGYTIAAINTPETQTYLGNVKVTVNGGTIVGQIAILNDGANCRENAEITLKGGSFTTYPYSNLSNPSQDIVINTNTNVIVNNSVGTLSDALDNINDNDTIVLIKDAEVKNKPITLNKKLIIDLNGKNLKLNSGSKYYAFTVENGSLTVKNGVINAYYGIALCKNNSNVELEDLNINGSSAYIKYLEHCNNMNVSLKNTVFKTSCTYAIHTEASTNPTSSNVNLTIINSDIESRTFNKDNTGILFNVKGKVYIEDSTISGDRQGLILRAGEGHIIKNSTIKKNNAKTNYSDAPENKDGIWQGGNGIPASPLVIGNQYGSYYPVVSVTLEDVKFENAANTEDIYIWKNDEQRNIGTDDYKAQEAKTTVTGNVIGSIKTNSNNNGATVYLYDTSWYNSGLSEFTLSTAEELSGLAYLVNNDLANFKGKTVKLANDIDLTGRKWETIGHYTPDPKKYFEGTFDGQNYKVTGVYVTGNYSNGFFQVVRDATIKNLTLGITTRASGYGAGLTGYTYGTTLIENIIVNCDLSGTNNNSAIVGNNKGGELTIQNVIVNGKIEGEKNCAAIVGGNAATLTITKATNNATIHGLDTGIAAGLVAYQQKNGKTTIIASVNNGDVSTESESNAVSGIFGWSHDKGTGSVTIINTQNNGNVTQNKKGSASGFVCGDNNVSLLTSAITIKTDKANYPGEATKNTGNITANGGCASGILAEVYNVSGTDGDWAWDVKPVVLIEGVTNAGTITGKKVGNGIIVDKHDVENVTITNCSNSGTLTTV